MLLCAIPIIIMFFSSSFLFFYFSRSPFKNSIFCLALHIVQPDHCVFVLLSEIYSPYLYKLKSCSLFSLALVVFVMLFIMLYHDTLMYRDALHYFPVSWFFPYLTLQDSQINLSPSESFSSYVNFDLLILTQLQWNHLW